MSGAQTAGLSTTATWGQAKTFALSVDGTPLTSPSSTGTTLWYTWDTTGTANGSRTLTATVTMNGQTATATLPVTVANAASFAASITYPRPGATVSGNQSVGTSTTAAWGQAQTFTLWHTWNMKKIGNGTRTRRFRSR